MAYVIEASGNKIDLTTILPINHTLPNGKSVQLIEATEKHYEQMKDILNYTIEEGGTYPQQQTLTFDQFKSYYISHRAFCVIPTKEYIEEENSEVKEDQVLGCFYIKPNFPGNCSHICNGGFLTQVNFRRKGIARFMGISYLKLAKALGYRASMFNLVFVTNVASLNLWRSLGFKEIGIIPGAGHFPKIQEGYIDAIQFYYDLTTYNN